MAVYPALFSLTFVVVVVVVVVIVIVVVVVVVGFIPYSFIPTNEQR